MNIDKPIAAIMDDYRRDLLTVAQESTAKVISVTVAETPVGEVYGGSLRASWTANIGTPKANNFNFNPSHKDHKKGRNDHTAVVNSMKLGDVVYVVNGQPYAHRIEYEGWSAKAPGGMMRVALAQWSAIVDGEIRGV